MAFRILLLVFGAVHSASVPSPAGAGGAIREECGYQNCPATEAGVLNVHIVAHTHDDVGWLKTVDQYYYGSKNFIQKAGVQYILDSVVKELWEDPKRRFIYVETAFFWKWWVRQTDKIQSQVRTLVAESRLQFVGGAWSMNDEAATHYQSTIDQFTWGLSKINDTFGECALPRVGWQIDPFGHSREFASLLAGMGYDGLFLGRIDYQDKSSRLAEKNMEMLWRGNDDLGRSSDIFTSVLYNTYSPPPGFCFDVLCSDEPIVDDIYSPMYNVDEKVDRFMEVCARMAVSYATNNILVTMGDDFQYQDAGMWYNNLDKLIQPKNDDRCDASEQMFPGKFVPDVLGIFYDVALFISYVAGQAKHYRTDNVAITMGGDFTYQDAGMWYTNLDKLIKYTNLKAAKDGLNIKLFYSTPNCYLKAVKDANPVLPVKQDDFFPYASDPNSYWTGYFTSRPTTKLFEREGNNYLQVAKQLQVLANLEPHNIFMLNSLKSVMGVMQHHDAITGTEKQHVANDYVRMLSQGIDDALIIPHQAFIKVMQGDTTEPPALTYHRCRLNESSCHTSETSDKLVVTLYNPVAWSVNEPVRIPVTADNYEVYAPNGEKIQSQVEEIPDYILRIATRESLATHEVVFIAKLEPLMYKSFYIRNLNRAKRGTDNEKKTELTKLGKVSNVNIENKDSDIRKLTKDSNVNIENKDSDIRKLTKDSNVNIENKDSDIRKLTKDSNVNIGNIKYLENSDYITPLRQDIIVNRNIKDYENKDVNVDIGNNKDYENKDVNVDIGNKKDYENKDVNVDIGNKKDYENKDVNVDIGNNKDYENKDVNVDIGNNKDYENKDSNVDIIKKYLQNKVTTVAIRNIQNDFRADILKNLETKETRQKIDDSSKKETANASPVSDDTKMAADDPTVVEKLEDYFVMKNEDIEVRIDNTSGEVRRASFPGVDSDFGWNMFYYPACVGNNEVPINRSSGAYIFRPNATQPIPLQRLDYNFTQGAVFSEHRVAWSHDVYTTTRLYNDADHIDMQWFIGDIDIADNIGKEYIIRYTTDLVSNGEFYTDSNGRQTLKRKLNKRPQWNLTIAEPIAGNYYPVTNEIFLEDDNSRFTVLTDRAEGGSSLIEGDIDLMLHRRLLHDDAFGVGESLNETINGKGLEVLGEHRLFFSKGDHMVERKNKLTFHLKPLVFVADAKDLTLEEWLKLKNCFSWLKQPMPEGVHLLTLEPWDDKILLRLENFLTSSDTSTVEVDLASIIKNVNVKSVKETTLSAYEEKSRKRWTWKTENDFFASFNREYGSFGKVQKAEDIAVEADDGFRVKIAAKDIRTFIIDYDYVE